MPAPSPQPSPAPPGLAEMRTLMRQIADGEAALARLAALMDERAIYADDMEPRPVYRKINGEVIKIQPISFDRIAEAPPPPAPSAVAPPKLGAARKLI